MRRPLPLALAFTAALAAAPLAAQSPAPAAPPKAPPGAGTKAATPGTQTEDDVHVGIRRPAPSGRGPEIAPGKGRNPRTGAGTSPNTGRAGGDDELDELEVERRKGPDAPRPRTDVLPPPKPSVGNPSGRPVQPGGVRPAPGRP